MVDNLKRMKELSELLNAYAKAYYVHDEMQITDAEYDVLFDELLALEKSTETVLPSSPTNRVGGAPQKKFESHNHITPLWSLDKCKTHQELFAWEKRMRRIIADYEKDGESLPPLSYSLEYKFDGLTVNLTYNNGTLIQAATRGNGTTGEAI